ncbi:MAG: hypothetical protein GXP47_05065 [Acidobacteria bacterium]|nr:hypothetical protein [Acidobacteriota bacterium]
MSSEDPRGPRVIPEEWDRLLDLAEGTDRGGPDAPPEPEEPEAQGAFPLLTAACADLVAILIPCAMALVGLRLGGQPVPLRVAPWALALGVAWWLPAAGILLRVRRGTPGMLAAGLAWRDEPAGGRLWGTLALALLAAATLGLPLALFRRAVWKRLEAPHAATG